MTRLTPALMAAFVVLALAAPPARAASARDDLLRRVPDDVAFCLVVQDLREHWQTLRDSPFGKALAASPWAAAVRATPEFRQLADADAFLARSLGLGLAGLRDDLCGDAVVLAFRPKGAAVGGQDQGLLLARGRDARTLDEFVGRLNAAQKASGELQSVEELRHAGAVYHRRVDKNGEAFYALDGPVLLVSNQERFLREALERREPAAGLPVLARRLDEVGAGRALAGLWINPRAFDAEMRKNAAAAAADAAAVQQGILKVWEALDGIGLALHHGSDAQVALGLRADPARLPPALRRLADAAARPCEVWEHLPPRAMLTVAGRVDAAALLDLLGEFLTPEARTGLREALQRHLGDPVGKDFGGELLAALGPDVGLSVTAPASAGDGVVPGLVLAVRVRPGADEADRAVLAAVHLYAQMAVVAHNRTNPARLRLKTEKVGDAEVRTLAGVGVFPLGVQPAFALAGGWLRLATLPRLAAASGTGRAAAPEGEVMLALLSVGEVRRYLQEHRPGLVALLAERDKVTRAEAGRRIDALRDVADRLDRVEVTGRLDPGRLLLTLRVTPTLPLK